MRIHRLMYRAIAKKNANISMSSMRTAQEIRIKSIYKHLNACYQKCAQENYFKPTVEAKVKKLRKFQIAIVVDKRNRKFINKNIIRGGYT